jgi:hypothetical protein
MFGIYDKFEEFIQNLFCIAYVSSYARLNLFVTHDGMYATSNTATYFARKFGIKLWSLRAGQPRYEQREVARQEYV